MRLSPLLAGALAVALGLLPIAPPEHAHEAGEQGHTHVVVHRHAGAHGLLEHHGEHGTAPELEDNDHDGPAVTLFADYILPAAAVVAVPQPQAISASIEPLKPVFFERPFTDVDILIHGPPRAPAGLRAPPVSPAS